MSTDRPVVDVLGIPSPEHIVLSDGELKTTYQAFCGNLRAVGGGQAVKCDTGFFYLGDTRDHISKKEFPKLRLLAALLRADGETIDEIFKRTLMIDNVDHMQGKFDGHKYDLSIALALKELEAFSGHPDYAALTNGTLPWKCLSSVSSELSSAPGMTWQSYIEVIDFNSDWAIVLYLGDSEEEQVTAFPLVVGFARKAELVRSVGRLLVEEDAYWTYQSAYFSGDDLIVACWARWGDEGEWSFGPVFLSLSDAELSAVLEEYGDLLSSELAEDFQELIRIGDNLLGLNDCSPDAVLRIFSRFGKPRTPGHIKRLIRRLQRVEVLREERDEQEWDRHEAERKAAVEAAYKAAPIRPPASFPEEMRVDQLTPDQMLSLKKWMQEEAGWTGCSVAYGPAHRLGRPLSFLNEFVVSLHDENGLAWMSFPSTRELPTVREAFNQLRDMLTKRSRAL